MLPKSCFSPVSFPGHFCALRAGQFLDEAAKEGDNGAQGLDFSVKNFFMPFPPPLLWRGAMPLPFLPAQKKRCVPLKARTCGALISL